MKKPDSTERSAVASTDQALYSPRGLVAEKEFTRDPIFLFQYRTYKMAHKVSSMSSMWGLTADDEGIVFSLDGEEISNKTLCEMGYLVEAWETERVYGTRAEGENYGKGRSYAYPNGWRVYCVCAEGKLAELLVKHWKG